MILSSLAVVYINTAATRAAGQASISNVYDVYGSATNSNSSNAEQLGKGFVNALVIVLVICAMTFVIVLLYKYRCMKILICYMMLSTILLLGFLSSVMFNTAVQAYGLTIDAISFYWTIFNFAAVGTMAIFWQKGIPAYISQFYSIMTSVIVAWQLSYFDAWTAWLLLILLALYDLFAVLSPCGPLKALVKLMQRPNAPEMPGLLYEANLPVAARRRSPEDRTIPATTGIQPTADQHLDPMIEHIESHPEEHMHDDTINSLVQLPANDSHANGITESVDRESDARNPLEPIVIADPNEVTGLIPLALAKMYKLPPVENYELDWMPDAHGNSTQNTFTPQQLQSLVRVHFPVAGGRIREHPVQARNEEIRYDIFDRNGVLKRTLFVTDDGRVFEVLSEEGKDKNNIKLGLGDFIFYSVLVSEAAVYSFTTFAACTLVILAGLGVTLLLLAMYGQALPALPVSIFLGVIFFLLTRYFIQPWTEAILIQSFYV
jgi:presenilin 1